MTFQGVRGREVSGAWKSGLYLTSPVKVDVVSAGGWLACLICASLFLSAIPAMRPSILGLSTHPYVGALVLALPLAFSRGQVGPGVGIAPGVFLGVLVASSLVNVEIEGTLSVLIKWLTVFLTYWVVRRLIKTRRDFELASSALLAAVAVMAARGLLLHQLGGSAFVEALPGIGNRNAFAPWAISPMCLGMALLARPTVGRVTKIGVMTAMAVIVATTVLSLSRGGWVLLAVLGIVTLAGRLKPHVIVAGLLAVVSLQELTARFQLSDALESRVVDLRQGTESDDRRLELIEQGLRVFAENPILGVSIAGLPHFLQLAPWEGPVSSHNLYIEILAGLGLLGAIPFYWCAARLFVLWRSGLRRGLMEREPELTRVFPAIMSGVAVAGLTSNEVLYCPAVVVGLALAHSLVGAGLPSVQQAAGRRVVRLNGVAPQQGVREGAS